MKKHPFPAAIEPPPKRTNFSPWTMAIIVFVFVMLLSAVGALVMLLVGLSGGGGSGLIGRQEPKPPAAAAAEAMAWLVLRPFVLSNDVFVVGMLLNALLWSILSASLAFAVVRFCRRRS